MRRVRKKTYLRGASVTDDEYFSPPPPTTDSGWDDQSGAVLPRLRAREPARRQLAASRRTDSCGLRLSQLRGDAHGPAEVLRPSVGAAPTPAERRCVVERGRVGRSAVSVVHGNPRSRPLLKSLPTPAVRPVVARLCSVSRSTEHDQPSGDNSLVVPRVTWYVMSSHPHDDGSENSPRCGNCGAPLTRRETGMLSMSVGTRCPECGVLT